MHPDLIVAIVVTLLLGTAAVSLLSLSPIGRAIAARRAERRRPAVDAVEVDELEALRSEVAELTQRLDFTEGLLARKREPGPR